MSSNYRWTPCNHANRLDSVGSSKDVSDTFARHRVEAQHVIPVVVRLVVLKILVVDIISEVLSTV